MYTHLINIYIYFLIYVYIFLKYMHVFVCVYTHKMNVHSTQIEYILHKYKLIPYVNHLDKSFDIPTIVYECLSVWVYILQAEEFFSHFPWGRVQEGQFEAAQSGRPDLIFNTHYLHRLLILNKRQTINVHHM